MKFAALAALLLAVPAAAQDRAAEIDFQNALSDSQIAKSAQSRAAIARTLDAMNDGPEAGGKVVAYLREHGIEVNLKTQAEASKTVVVDGRASITLSDALPPLPRVYGPLIAKEAAALELADMPACAERSYMRRGTAGRVWLELGGVPSMLPGVEAKAVIDEISVWADKDGAQMALYKIGQAEKLSSIPELEGAASKAERTKLDEANARFVAFLMDEKFARNDVGLR